MMTTEDEGASCLFTPIFQHAKYHMAEKNVDKHCKPTIKQASYKPKKNIIATDQMFS